MFHMYLNNAKLPKLTLDLPKMIIKMILDYAF